MRNGRMVTDHDILYCWWYTCHLDYTDGPRVLITLYVKSLLHAREAENTWSATPRHVFNWITRRVPPPPHQNSGECSCFRQDQRYSALRGKYGSWTWFHYNIMSEKYMARYFYRMAPGPSAKNRKHNKIRNHIKWRRTIWQEQKRTIWSTCGFQMRSLAFIWQVIPIFICFRIRDNLTSQSETVLPHIPLKIRHIEGCYK